MANRYLKQFWYSFIAQPVALFADLAIGGSGAPTLTANAYLGFTSVARTGAGTYLVTLQDKYNRLLHASVKLGGSAFSGVFATEVTTDSVASAGTLVFTCYDATGTAVDPASGSSMKIKLELKNSSLAG